MSRTRRTFAAATVAAGILLTGCGIEERIVHLQPAPTAAPATGAPLRQDAAERIAARVLADVATAASSEDRTAIMTGPAIRLSSARLAQGKQNAPAVGAVTVASPPQVLATTAGQDWPRAMLVSTLDEETQVNHLHVLVSTGASQRYQVHATAPLLAGASVPALGEFAAGTIYSASPAEEPLPASADLEEYAKALAFPKPTEATAVAVEDAYSTALKRNAKAQNDALGDLANLSQTHALIPDSVLGFRTADGGEVVFAQLVRTDVVTLTDKAKELKIGDAALQKLSGKQVVTKSFTTTTLENIVMVIPAGDAKAEVIGAEEVVLRAEGV